MAAPALTIRAVPVRLVLRLDDYVRDLLRDLSLAAAAEDEDERDELASILAVLRGVLDTHAEVCAGDRAAAEAAFDRQLERVDLSISRPGGRSLELVDAMTSRWGVSQDADGYEKAVWFEVDRGASASAAAQ